MSSAPPRSGTGTRRGARWSSGRGSATHRSCTACGHRAPTAPKLTFFPDPVSGASYQPTDGRYIVFTKDVGGAEFFQKYRYDVASGEITLLTDGKSRNVGGAWSHKGDHYAYMSTRRDGRDLDLWVMDLFTERYLLGQGRSATP